ncbi:hypothetical protein [Kineococcus sp. SYSU DK004]|uniref:hypothetical protein n=1 Tax=Kineococcus sp. SYSU DK004 TaxID=3383125 RepID=UPI003D7C51B7
MRHRTSRPVPRARRTGARAALVLAPLVLALSGCSAVDALGAPAAAGTAPATAETTVAPAEATVEPAVAPVAVEPVHDDLALGSAHRELRAGGLGLAVDYWSTLDKSLWTHGAAKPVSLAATLTGDGLGTGKRDKRAYISRVSVTSTAVDASGAVSAPVTYDDVARQAPGYLAMAPYGYSTSFVVPAVPEGVRSVELVISYDVLEQSAPGADDYSKQTATDTLVIALAEG